MKNIAAVIFALLFSGCAYSLKSPAISSEPSLERAVEILEANKESAAVINFIEKKGVRFEYSNLAGYCDTYNLKHKVIFIPEEYRASDKLLALAVAKAAMVYYIYSKTDINEILTEEDEAGALFQFRIAALLGLKESDFVTPASEKTKCEYSAYLVEGTKYALNRVRAGAAERNVACQRPYNSIAKEKSRLGRLRAESGKNTFYELLFDRNKERAMQGIITFPDMMKQDSQIRSVPHIELARYSDAFFNEADKSFSAIQKEYSKLLKKDAEMRDRDAARILRLRDDFLDCYSKCYIDKAE